MEPRTETQHIVPVEGKWGVRAENSQQPSKTFDTKLLAVMYAFDIADNNEGKVVIHDQNGKITDVKVTEDSSKLLTALSA